MAQVIEAQADILTFYMYFNIYVLHINIIFLCLHFDT